MEEEAKLTSPRERIEGASRSWDVDIIVEKPWKFIKETREDMPGIGVVTGGTFEWDSVPRAILECKFAGVIPDEKRQKGSSLDSNLARAYVHLNDIHLNEPRIKLFVVVNREAVLGEQRRDYQVLFRNIGVQFINFGNPISKERLGREVASLRP